VLLDEVQQEVQRPLELLEPNRVGLEDGLELLLMFHIKIAEGRKHRMAFTTEVAGKTEKANPSLLTLLALW
jgi:hypothetical protein